MRVTRKNLIPTSVSEYRYREGVHGEHCVDYGVFVWERKETVGRASSREDAQRLADELNALNRAMFSPPEEQ